MAHGMVAPDMFLGDAGIYTWWLVLRIVAGPVAAAILQSNDAAGASPVGEAESLRDLSRPADSETQA